MGSKNGFRTHEEYVKLASEASNDEYIIIDTYVNYKVKLRTKHKNCGSITMITPDNFLNKSQRCKDCRIKDKFTKRVKELVGGEYTFLEDYTGIRNFLLVRHNGCGGEYEVNPKLFLEGSRCNLCKVNKQRFTNEEFLEKVNALTSGEFTFLSRYVNISTSIPVRHNKCGYVYKVRPDNFLNGRRCAKCSGKKTYTTDEFKERIKVLTNGKYEVISEYYKNDVEVKMRHIECGYEYYVKPTNFTSLGLRCRNCSSSASKGEDKVMRKLRSMNVLYEMEYTFKELKNRRFDFYLPEYNACIEFDGIQHYEPVAYFGGKEKLLYTQKSDKLKNIFCDKNDITLLRIPYWDIENIDGIVSDFITRHLRRDA